MSLRRCRLSKTSRMENLQQCISMSNQDRDEKRLHKPYRLSSPRSAKPTLHRLQGIQISKAPYRLDKK